MCTPWGRPSFPQKPGDSPVVPCPRGRINRFAAGVSPDLVAPILVRAPSEMGVVSLPLDPLCSGAHTFRDQIDGSNKSCPHCLGMSCLSTTKPPDLQPFPGSRCFPTTKPLDTHTHTHICAKNLERMCACGWNFVWFEKNEGRFP